MLNIHLIYFRCILYTAYNLNYTPATVGYKAEEKLYLGVREQKKVEYHCSR
jgi:hypothetical protein